MIIRFVSLVISLNLVRYVIGGTVAMLLFQGQLFEIMEQNSSYFNFNFTTTDWITSYFYNFMMWLCCAWIYQLTYQHISGNDFVKSFKIYGLCYLFFTSISLIYMNHYSHTKLFYVFTILDGAVAFASVAAANGWLHGRFFYNIPDPDKLDS